MSSDNRREKMHTLDVTLWVGKNGIESVVDELADQFDERRFVKVKFHRSSRAGTDTDELAEKLANRVNATVVDTRGHTAVIER